MSVSVCASVYEFVSVCVCVYVRVCVCMLVDLMIFSDRCHCGDGRESLYRRKQTLPEV